MLVENINQPAEFNAVHFPCNYTMYIKFNTKLSYNIFYLLINAPIQP